MSKNSYYIERYSPEAITISIDAEIADHLQLVLDARFSKRFLDTLTAKKVPFDDEIRKLISFGGDYIDIGVHSNWIAVELPNTTPISHQQVTEIVETLKQIGQKSGRAINSQKR